MYERKRHHNRGITFIIEENGVGIILTNVMDRKMGMDKKSIEKNFYVLCIVSALMVFSMAAPIITYPGMLKDFDLGVGYAVWLELGFALGITGFQPFFGWLEDVFGPKKVALLGTGLMFTGTILTALSPFFSLIVVSLFIQGLAGAAVIPIGYSFIGKNFDESDRGKALGIFGIFAVIGAAIGPFASGTIVELMGWSAIFFFCAFLSAIAFLLTFIKLPNIKGNGSTRLDYLAVLLIMFVMGGILTVPIFINNYGVSTPLWIPSFVIFIISFLLLILVEKKQGNPLLDVKYAKDKRFWVPALIVTFLFVSYSGTLNLIVFFVQDFQQKSPAIAGLLITILFVTTAIGSILAGKFISELSARTVMAPTIALVLGGTVMLIFVGLDVSVLYLSVSMSLIGIGIGIAGPATKTIVLSGANPLSIGVTIFTFSTIENAVQRVGASFALITFSLFSFGGDGLRGLTDTALYLSIFCAMAFWLLPLIPNRVEGFNTNEKRNARNNNEKTLAEQRVK